MSWLAGKPTWQLVSEQITGMEIVDQHGDEAVGRQLGSVAGVAGSVRGLSRDYQAGRHASGIQVSTAGVQAVVNSDEQLDAVDIELVLGTTEYTPITAVDGVASICAAPVVPDDLLHGATDGVAQLLRSGAVRHEDRSGLEAWQCCGHRGHQSCGLGERTDNYGRVPLWVRCEHTIIAYGYRSISHLTQTVCLSRCFGDLADLDETP